MPLIEKVSVVASGIGKGSTAFVRKRRRIFPELLDGSLQSRKKIWEQLRRLSLLTSGMGITG